MYKLVIADDEQKIRTLLSKIINWNELGFEVVRLCSDGNEVIEYLKKHSVDCILCDIRMKNTSGIDIAKYVYNNAPRIKVILLSGYQDFGYATAALRYNAENYLLKPAKVPELKSTFMRVRENLDMQKSHLDIMSNYRREIFTNLISGYYKDISSIAEAFANVHLEFTTDDSFAVVKIRFSTPMKCEDYPISHFYQNIVNLGSSPLSAFFVYSDDVSVTYLMFSKFKGSDTFLDFAGCICSNITDISKVECSIDSFSYFENAADFCSNADNSHDPYNVLFAQNTKHLSIAIASGSREDIDKAVSSISENISDYSIDDFSDYFKKIAEKLDFPQQPDNGLDLKSFYSRLKQCRNISSAADAAKKYFYDLSLCLHSTDVQNQNILRVRNYVMEHCSDDLSLEKSAAMAYLSPTYFSKVFKSITGQTYVDFVIDCKMNKAKDLLINSQMKIYEISNAVGYRSTGSFVKLFKASCGITPTEYRNKFTKGVY